MCDDFPHVNASLQTLVMSNNHFDLISAPITWYPVGLPFSCVNISYLKNTTQTFMSCCSVTYTNNIRLETLFMTRIVVMFLKKISDNFVYATKGKCSSQVMEVVQYFNVSISYLFSKKGIKLPIKLSINLSIKLPIKTLASCILNAFPSK